MSNFRHTEATLDGYEGPFFPPSVDDLREQLDKIKRLNGLGLSGAVNRVEGFVGWRYRSTTSDGYTWFWALEFFSSSGTVAVLIPWRQDFDKSDGTQNDRSIAVYTQDVDEDAADQVVQQFARAVTPQR